MEAALVIGWQGEVIHRHQPSGRTIGSLPDDRHLWVEIWENRAHLLGVAHSHPGAGFPHPSQTDITTFKAIENALGRRLHWWITTQTHIGLWIWSPRAWSGYEAVEVIPPEWVETLHEISHYEGG